MGGSSGSDVYTFTGTATGTIETFIVPQTGTYFIAAFGAEGGAPDSNDALEGGAPGGEAASNFSLIQGETIEIAVGGQGENGSALPVAGSRGGGGGGGGSFVVLDQDGTLTPLIVAGGGGGEPGEAGGATIGGDGQGGTFDASPGAGGGGGFYGDGQASTATITSLTGFEPQGGHNSTGGKSFVDGLAGGYGGSLYVGIDYFDGGSGGLGGGGGGGPYEGGGGGGYTGGSEDQGGSSYVSPSAIGSPILVAGGNTAETGKVLIEYPACFLQGTRLAAPSGQVPVETLRPGDRLMSHRRGVAVPVTWVGHRQFDGARHPRPQTVLPVRVCAGAFGPGLPERDLRLSPDHAVFFAGVLIPVRALIDGRSVVQEPAGTITYWHVELDEHDIILAEGLPAESFLDTGQRAAFAGGPVAQCHPDFAARAWEAAGCAPLRLVGPEVDAAQALLDQRSEQRRAA